MTTPLDEARQAVDSAAERYVSDRASLYRADGERRFSEAEHAEREAAALAPLHQARDRALAAVEAEMQTLRRFEEAQHEDPSRLLTAGELAEANARSQFVREDAASLPIPALCRQLRAALAASGDPPPVVDRFLYSRYAGQRLAAERESRGERGVTTASEDLAELAELVRRFTLPRPGALAPGESLRRARAARELRQYVSNRVGEVHGETERTRERLLSPGIYR